MCDFSGCIYDSMFSEVSSLHRDPETKRTQKTKTVVPFYRSVSTCIFPTRPVIIAAVDVGRKRKGFARISNVTDREYR